MSTLNDLIRQIDNEDLRKKVIAEVAKIDKQKKFGLVFEDHLPECTPLYDMPVKKGAKVSVRTGKVNETYTVSQVSDGVATCLPKYSKKAVAYPVKDLVVTAEFGDPIYPYLRPLDKVCNAPDSDLWHTLIEADNYHALQLLEYLYAGKVDCIYIDPPYNTGAKDWKYNNNYIDTSDSYRHSKWLSFMQRRLRIAKKLLNPDDSVLIVTIDEKEYLHLGCLLEEMFPEARIQMVSCCINPSGVARMNEFRRTDEYIYFVKFGSCSPVSLQLDKEWMGNVKGTSKEKVRWAGLMRSGTDAMREDCPNLFYPIFVSKDGKRFVDVGDSLPLEEKRESVIAPPGTIAVWPLRLNGSEGRWQVSKETLIDLQQKHFVKLGTFTERGVSVSYLKNGEQKKVSEGIYAIKGVNEDGSYILDDSDYTPDIMPGTQWFVTLHNASTHGSSLLRKIFNGKVFSFPKSLYAVHDCIRFFVANKPNALIIDFFAGSGTTLHAVNLLNAEDGGKRRCILVTNNEVSGDEAAALKKQGFKPGDKEWEKLGVARYVTWPRTVCSIEGHDIDGNPLAGTYANTDIPMRDGFAANAEFFKLDFLDKNKVELGRQFREILPIIWMKSGAVGPRPVLETNDLPKMLVPDNGNFAVLIDEGCFMEFMDKLEIRPDIKHIYLTTNSEDAFTEMCSRIHTRTVTQLYRDYIDNFVINNRRV